MSYVNLAIQSPIILEHQKFRQLKLGPAQDTIKIPNDLLSAQMESQLPSNYLLKKNIQSSTPGLMPRLPLKTQVRTRRVNTLNGLNQSKASRYGQHNLPSVLRSAYKLTLEKQCMEQLIHSQMKQRQQIAQIYARKNQLFRKLRKLDKKMQKLTDIKKNKQIIMSQNVKQTVEHKSIKNHPIKEINTIDRSHFKANANTNHKISKLQIIK